MGEEHGFIWRNGEIVHADSKEAMISVSNHSLHYGSAVFEGIRFYETPGNKGGGSAIFRLEDHVDRLFYSASAIGNDIRDHTREELSEAVVMTIRANALVEGYVRPIVFDGGGIGIDFGNKRGEIAIMAFPWKRYKEEGVRVFVSSIRKTDPRTTDVNAKIAGNYHNSVLAHKEASENGYDECLLLDYRANIAEGPGENIFFVKDRKLITPTKGTILSGITRDTILEIGKENGFEVEERVVRPREIYMMDEAFFCGTAVEITPITEIVHLGRSVKYEIHEVTNQFRDLYMDTVRGKNGHLEEWLTFI